MDTFEFYLLLTLAFLCGIGAGVALLNFMLRSQVKNSMTMQESEKWAVRLYSRLYLLRQAYKSGDRDLISEENVRAASILAEFKSNFYEAVPQKLNNYE